MKGLKRNKQRFYYCLLNPDVQEYALDEHGNETGEVIPEYYGAVEAWANISPATGQSNTEQFGNFDDYDRVIVTAEMDCPIDENTVLFVDVEPSYTTIQTHRIENPDTVLGGDLEETEYQLPKYNYIVKRIARSLNVISIAIRKVDVG